MSVAKTAQKERRLARYLVGAERNELVAFLEKRGYVLKQNFNWIPPKPDHEPDRDEAQCISILRKELGFGGLSNEERRTWKPSITSKIEALRRRKAAERNHWLQQRYLPLSAFYGKDPDHEARRAQFYRDCAEQFRWPGNRVLDPLDAIKPDPELAEGFGGKGRNVTREMPLDPYETDMRSAPFEYFKSCGCLVSENDESQFGSARWDSGLKLRSLLLGSETRSLKSVDLDPMPNGTGGFMNVSDFRLDCLQKVMSVRSEFAPHRMPPEFKKIDMFSLLERLVYRDDWSVIEVPKAQRKAVVNAIHYGLDCLSLMWGFIEPKEFSRRWG